MPPLVPKYIFVRKWYLVISKMPIPSLGFPQIVHSSFLESEGHATGTYPTAWPSYSEAPEAREYDSGGYTYLHQSRFPRQNRWSGMVRRRRTSSWAVRSYTPPRIVRFIQPSASRYLVLWSLRRTAFSPWQALHCSQGRSTCPPCTAYSSHVQCCRSRA